MRALVVGSGGQDGTLLTAHLRERGYEVVGAHKTDDPLRHIASSLDEVYYLAAYHHSSEDPPVEPRELFERSIAVHVTGLLDVLDAIRERAPRARLFYAASSLVFGEPRESPQTETTPFQPTCAYGISKTAGLHICRHYRQAHGIHASVGILYNHESSLRAEKFVSQKIVKAAWAIKRGTRDKLVLGNLGASIDWGYAPDFVDAMHRIASLDAPDDFIIATGETHTVGEFVDLAFGQLGLDWKQHIEENRGLITRPSLVRVGSIAKLTRVTGWRPSTSFPGMVRALIDAEASRAPG